MATQLLGKPRVSIDHEIEIANWGRYSRDVSAGRHVIEVWFPGRAVDTGHAELAIEIEAGALITLRYQALWWSPMAIFSGDGGRLTLVTESHDGVPTARVVS